MPGEFDFQAAADQIGADLLGDDLSSDHDDDDITAAPTPAATPAAPAPAPTDLGNGATATATAAPGTPAPAPITSAPTPADPLLVAPKTWKPDVAARWGEIPDWARAEIARREDDFYKGLDQYKQYAGTGKQLQQTLAPYLQTLQQYNIDPFQQISSLMRAHHTLALGSAQEKRAMLETLNRDYNLGLDFGQAPYVDPAVEALQKQVQDLQSHTQRTQDQQRAERQAQAQREIEAFAADPKNAYFDECADEIAILIRQGMPLADAYSKAVWMNPTTRAKEVARLQSEQSAATEKAAREAAEKAKQASGTRRPAQKPGSPTAPKGSLDETLSATLAEIKNRNQ